MIGASLAAVPALVAYATITTTTLLVFTTTSISWPILGIGAVVLGGTALAGGKSIDRTISKRREALAASLEALADENVLGIGKAPNADCILSRIQAAVLRKAEAIIREEMV